MQTPKRFTIICLFWLFAWQAVATGADRPEPLPYLGRVTATSAVLNILPPSAGFRYYITYRQRHADQPGAWVQTQTRITRTDLPVEWPLAGLTPGGHYEYRIWSRPDRDGEFKAGRIFTFRTPPAQPEPASFAIFSDSHITPGQPERSAILSALCDRIDAGGPDFVMMLGDNIQTFDSHGGPMGKPEYGPLLYRLFRSSLGRLPAERPCYFLNGNWEGENGWHPEFMRNWARQARQVFIPGPTAATYPHGGSDGGDYYAFTWGGMLCIVLNVTGYTPTDHAHGSTVGRHDDWTLGNAQTAWLQRTLKTASSRLKLIFIHHPVGGGAPDDRNARYGRGGGLAAGIGQQAQIHRWMREYGVQALFYGHDHVFADNVVDGIHYICVGSAGAPWKFTARETGYRRYWTSSGYTWVEAAGDGLTVSFVDTGGGIQHRFTCEPKGSMAQHKR